MTKYFLINNNRLVKGITAQKNFFLAETAFEVVNNSWAEINPNEINDRLLGYDPSEESMYGIGCSDIAEEIQEISEMDAIRIMNSIKIENV